MGKAWRMYCGRPLPSWTPGQAPYSFYRLDATLAKDVWSHALMLSIVPPRYLSRSSLAVLETTTKEGLIQLDCGSGYYRQRPR